MNFVFIHGLAASKNAFIPLQKELQLCIPNAKFLSFDLPGFGVNEKQTGSFTLPVFLEYITHQVASTFGDQKIILIGHSFGGILASAWAKENPQQIEQLVLICTPTATTKEDLYHRITHRFSFSNIWGYLLGKYPNSSHIACTILCKHKGMHLLKFLKPSYVPDVVFEDYTKHTFDGLYKTFTNVLLAYPVVPLLQDLTAPILNIIGSQDTPLLSEPIALKQVKNIQLTGGHLLLLEYPALVAQTISESLHPYH